MIESKAALAGEGAAPRSRETRRRAREVQSGAARAAVLGVNDGLVTNAALILGVAGAQASVGFVRLAGLASLVAGACSMAVGEYVSMAAQVELLQRLLGDYRETLREDPERARQELEDIIARVGVAQATAHNASQQIAADPAHALAVYARSLGLDPDELGSPWKAAISSLLTFALGAAVPLAPWFFAPRGGTRAAALSLLLAAIFAAAIGGTLGWLSGRGPVLPALRQVAIAALATSLTWAVGHLFGVALT